LYDSEYYASHLGVPYTWSNPWWPEFFGRIADAVVAHVQPRTALDAGCALGFMVAALRDRGVEAHGIDISDFAIGEVPAPIRDFCRVASIREPLGNDYDVIVCIEVLEHLTPADAEPVIANLCAHAPAILFSSTPTDDVEPTHFNVREPAYWAALFARHSYFRDEAFDAGVVAPHACLYVRRERDVVELAASYEELYVHARLRQADLDERCRTLEARLINCEAARAAAPATLSGRVARAIRHRLAWFDRLRPS
jgi:hypothetical protein